MTDHKKRVLIAEDERPLSHALELKLQHEGYVTATAFNGQQCLDQLAAAPFDVLLLDLMMPVLDGFQVLEKLQQSGGGSRPKVIVLSNLSQHEDEERVMALQADGFFIKSNTSLAAIVDKVKQL